MTYTAYFDSGTTNSRLYLLDGQDEIVTTARCEVGAKDSAKARNGEVQTRALYGLYTEVLKKEGLADSDVKRICISGNVTARYGVHEVPHGVLPLDAQAFSRLLFTFKEDKYFRREISLVPGVKQLNEDFALTGLARGEEIELFGMADTLLGLCGKETAAVVMPGSHTHVAFMQGDRIAGLCSNMTGEIFHALKKDTVLAPVLEEAGGLQDEWIRKGLAALEEFGITRALYMAHTMRILETYEPAERRSFAEGVIFGGIVRSTAYFTEKLFPDCRRMLIAADGEVGQLYQTLFAARPGFADISLLPAGKEPWALQGYKKLFSQEKRS